MPELKHAVVIGRRYGTRVVTADAGRRKYHRLAEVTCDCGYVSRAAVFELENKGLGCPRGCGGKKRVPDLEKTARLKEQREQERLERAEAKRAAMLANRAARRACYARMHETMTLKEIGAAEGVHLSYVSLVLLGKR
jgi:hypothetical protein